MKYYRQGDICIVPASKGERPKNLKPVKRDKGRVVLAYGEVTGHAHAIFEDAAVLFEPTETADAIERWLQVGKGGAVLVHEEHGPITLPEGEYIVRTQREYSPEEIRRVVD